MRVTLSGCSIENSAQKSATACWGGGGVGLPFEGTSFWDSRDSLMAGRERRQGFELVDNLGRTK